MPKVAEKLVFEIEASRLPNGKLTSNTIIIGGLPWKLTVLKKWIGEHEYLALELTCNSESLNNIWNCVADVTFTISKICEDYQLDPTEKVYENQKFESSMKSILYDQIMPWEIYTDPENGYVSKKDISIFTAAITIKSEFGIVQDAFFEMKKRWDETADAVVRIGEKEVKIHKGFMSLNSTYFHSMLNGAFVEASGEIKLEDVDYDEFVEMLDVLIDVGKKTKTINANNVASILRMGDMFDIKTLVSYCVDFLIDTDDVKLFEKFRLSAMYNLSAVQERCLRSMGSLQQIVTFAKSPNFTELPIDTQLLILYRILVFLPSSY